MGGKGQETRRNILDSAVNLASEFGLEGLSLGSLAKEVGMSKSGLYAHFDSKEDLQSQTLNRAAEHVVNLVVKKALREPRGLPRVQALFDLWMSWADRRFRGGCPFIAAGTELDDREGPVRDTLVEHMTQLFKTIEKAALISVQEGHFRADLNLQQFAFDFWSVILGFHHCSRLLRVEDAKERACDAFTRLLENATSDSPANTKLLGGATVLKDKN